MERSARPPTAIPRPMAATARTTAAPAPVSAPTAAPAPVTTASGAPAPMLHGRKWACIARRIADGRAIDRGGRYAGSAGKADTGGYERRQQDSTHSEVSSPRFGPRPHGSYGRPQFLPTLHRDCSFRKRSQPETTRRRPVRFSFSLLGRSIDADGASLMRCLR